MYSFRLITQQRTLIAIQRTLHHTQFATTSPTRLPKTSHTTSILSRLQPRPFPTKMNTSSTVFRKTVPTRREELPLYGGIQPNSIPSHILPSSSYNPYPTPTTSPAATPLPLTTNPITMTTTSPNNSKRVRPYINYFFKSLFRLSLACALLSGATAGFILFFPKYAARAIGWWKDLSDVHKYILPTHSGEYFYPLHDDGYVPLPKLYRSYQTDLVKKLFHIFYELNYLESNYEDINTRLSNNYRELLKIRSYKIDDLDLWLLPYHLSKTQEKVKHELTVDERFAAQIDLDVLHYLREQLFPMYWEVIRVNMDLDIDPADRRSQRDELRELLDLKHEVDNLLDILDLTSLIAYQTKRFTYQWIPQSEEEKEEYRELHNIKQQHSDEFNDHKVSRQKFLGEEYLAEIPFDFNKNKTIIPTIPLPIPGKIFETDEMSKLAANPTINTPFMSTRNWVHDSQTDQICFDNDRNDDDDGRNYDDRRENDIDYDNHSNNNTPQRMKKRKNMRSSALMTTTTTSHYQPSFSNDYEQYITQQQNGTNFDPVDSCENNLAQKRGKKVRTLEFNPSFVDPNSYDTRDDKRSSKFKNRSKQEIVDAQQDLENRIFNLNASTNDHKNVGD